MIHICVINEWYDCFVCSVCTLMTCDSSSNPWRLHNTFLIIYCYYCLLILSYHYWCLCLGIIFKSTTTTKSLLISLEIKTSHQVHRKLLLHDYLLSQLKSPMRKNLFVLFLLVICRWGKTTYFTYSVIGFLFGLIDVIFIESLFLIRLMISFFIWFSRFITNTCWFAETFAH